MKEKKTKDRARKANLKDEKKEALFSELNSLLSSGLDFSRSFQLLIDSESDPKTKALLNDLYSRVISGVLLWQAASQTGRFTSLDCGLIRIGEETGKLNESLDFLSSYYSKKHAQRRIVLSALRYPLIVLGTALIVVVFMMMVIVPMFEQVYSRMGGELPALTKWIIGFSKSLPAYAAIAAILSISIGVLLYVFREKDTMRSAVANLSLKTPVVGNIMRKNNQAHFCKLLHILVKSGVPLLHAVEMLKDILVFFPYQRSFSVIAAGLQYGESFGCNLEKFPNLYDRKLIALLKVGEETNGLPVMLQRQGEEITKELEFQLQKLGGVLEPVLVLFVGILVAIILISMYMPMFKMGIIAE